MKYNKNQSIWAIILISIAIFVAGWMLLATLYLYATMLFVPKFIAAITLGKIYGLALLAVFLFSLVFLIYKCSQRTVPPPTPYEKIKIQKRNAILNTIGQIIIALIKVVLLPFVIVLFVLLCWTPFGRGLMLSYLCFNKKNKTTVIYHVNNSK